MDDMLNKDENSKAKEQKGASLVEYALLVALIAVVAIVAINSFSVAVSKQFSTIASELS